MGKQLVNGMESLPFNRKRSPPAPLDAWHRPQKDHRRHEQAGTSASESNGDRLAEKRNNESFAREQTRRNQIQEAEQMRQWVSKEDEFVLKQSKMKARIRVKEGRAKVIDWLAVILGVIDPTHDPLEDDPKEDDLEIVDPASLLEGLAHPELQALSKDIENYLALETNRINRDYWNVSYSSNFLSTVILSLIQALRVICKNHQSGIQHTKPLGRSVNVVSTDEDQLLRPKSLEELKVLEKQINSKLQSNEPINVEYWEQLLSSITVYKARAELDKVYKSIIEGRMIDLRHEQQGEAELAKVKLSTVLADSDAYKPRNARITASSGPLVKYSRSFDPEPHLKLRSEDKALEIVQEQDFLDGVVSQALEFLEQARVNRLQVKDRCKVVKMGYVPLCQVQAERQPMPSISKTSEATSSAVSGLTAFPSEDFSQATTALYEREVARGVQENEEIFVGEEEVSTTSKPQWANKYRPRKPRYFNRVQMGYEWNKYNQTHYDHENPPPKVVQGYKFNIFYPDLIDKVKAPTYRIEREGGRKRGQSFAPAGEEDTCLIRFISGPPYEDLAFRIVDKEWDYSAKRERGFRSSFDKVRINSPRCLKPLQD